MFNADIIRNTETNEYRAICSFPNRPDVSAEGIGWKAFWEDFRNKTGIWLPARKYFCFCKLSDFEQLAGVDASHVRKSCIVTKQDRLRGWRRSDFPEPRM